MDDNKFLDVVVDIGDGFLQILEKLGFKENEAQKIINTMQEQDLLEGTNIRGVWTEDGEIKVAEDTGVTNDNGQYVVRFQGPSLEAIKQTIADSQNTSEPIEPGDKAPEIQALIEEAKQEAGFDTGEFKASVLAATPANENAQENNGGAKPEDAGKPEDDGTDADEDNGTPDKLERSDKPDRPDNANENNGGGFENFYKDENEDANNGGGNDDKEFRDDSDDSTDDDTDSGENGGKGDSKDNGNDQAEPGEARNDRAFDRGDNRVQGNGNNDDDTETEMAGDNYEAADEPRQSSFAANEAAIDSFDVSTDPAKDDFENEDADGEFITDEPDEKPFAEFATEFEPSDKDADDETAYTQDATTVTDDSGNTVTGDVTMNFEDTNGVNVVVGDDRQIISVRDGDENPEGEAVAVNPGDTFAPNADFLITDNGTSGGEALTDQSEQISAEEYIETEEDRNVRAMLQARAAGAHSVPITDSNGVYTGEYITQDGVKFTPVDNTGEGVDDHVQEYQRINSIPEGKFGAKLVHANGVDSGYNIGRDGSVYNPAEDAARQDEYNKIRAMQQAQTMGTHSVPVNDENGNYTGQWITQDGNTYTPTGVGTRDNGLNDQQQAWVDEQAALAATGAAAQPVAYQNVGYGYDNAFSNAESEQAWADESGGFASADEGTYAAMNTPNDTSFRLDPGIADAVNDLPGSAFGVEPDEAWNKYKTYY